MGIPGWNGLDSVCSRRLCTSANSPTTEKEGKEVQIWVLGFLSPWLWAARARVFLHQNWNSNESPDASGLRRGGCPHLLTPPTLGGCHQPPDQQGRPGALGMNPAEFKVIFFAFLFCLLPSPFIEITVKPFSFWDRTHDMHNFFFLATCLLSLLAKSEIFFLQDFSKNYYVGISLVVQWLRIHLLMQDTQVQSLVGELRSHMPWGQLNLLTTTKSQCRQINNK